jgi:hypothetical protein
MKYSLASFETTLNLKPRIMSKAIMFWSSMIVVFFNVETFYERWLVDVVLKLIFETSITFTPPLQLMTLDVF